MKKRRTNFVVFKPKLTVLLCCYVWGFERPRNIWQVVA